MAPPDFYQTIAEISVGLAGFSGLIVAMRRTAGPLGPVTKFRLAVLLTLSFGAMFLALLPAWLFELCKAEEASRRLASAAMGTVTVIFLVWWTKASRKIAVFVPEIFNWYAFASMATGHVLSVSFQVTLVLGLVPGSWAGFYGFSLLWFLAHAAQQFARMLFIQPRPQSDQGPV